MDLRQAKMQLVDLRENQLSFVSDEDKNNKDNEFIKDADAIDTVLTALDNSVSKDELKEILRKYEYDENYTRQELYKELRELLNKGE